MSEPVFEDGEIVVCLNPNNYDFTKNKQYVVIEYDPPEPVEGIGFTWPAYIKLLDDSGKRVMCHANRFVSLKNQ